MRISGGREDKSRTWLYQVYRVYRAACEPAVFPQTECQECQVCQVYQVYQVFQRSLSGSGSLFQSFKSVSRVSEKFEWKWLTVSEFKFQVFQVGSVFWVDSAQFAHYFWSCGAYVDVCWWC